MTSRQFDTYSRIYTCAFWNLFAAKHLEINLFYSSLLLIFLKFKNFSFRNLKKYSVIVILTLDSILFKNYSYIYIYIYIYTRINICACVCICVLGSITVLLQNKYGVSDDCFTSRNFKIFFYIFAIIVIIFICSVAGRSLLRKTELPEVRTKNEFSVFVLSKILFSPEIPS